MNVIEQFVVERISRLIPGMTDVSFRASISEKTYSIEFFVSKDGVKSQCYDMVDNGMIDSAALKQCQTDIVDFVRKSEDFIHGKINKYRFTINNIGSKS